MSQDRTYTLPASDELAQPGFRDVALALRLLRHQSGFAAATIGTLALGIAVTCAVFSLVHAVLLAELPLPAADRVVALQARAPAAATASPIVSPLEISTWNAAQDAIEVVAVLGDGRTLLRAGLPERVAVLSVGEGFSRVLRTGATLGRDFAADDFRPDAPEVALASHRFWQESLGAEPTVVGATISVDGQPTRLIGVAAPSLATLAPHIDLLVPLRLAPAQWQAQASYMTAYGRLADGVDLDSATAALTVAQELVNERFDPEDRRSVELVPLRDRLVGSFERRILLLFAAVALVLLIACGNVANLLLARGLARSDELRVRTALGASRARVLRQLLAENLTLSLLAATLGLGGAALLLQGFLALAPLEVTGLASARIHTPVLLFAVVLAVLVTLVAGLAPALEASSTRRLSMRGEIGSRRSEPLRAALLSFQVALTLTLLIAAGLLLRSLHQESRVDPGFRAEHLLSFHLALPQANYPDRAAVVQTYERVVEQLRALPEIRNAGAANRVPLSGSSLGVEFHRPEQPETRVSAALRIVSAGYFDTAAVPLLAGRDFSAEDDADAPPVVVVNRSLADSLWGPERPIGARLSSDNYAFRSDSGEPLRFEVVGIVADTRDHGLRSPPRPAAFVVLGQAPEGPWSWLSNTLAIVLRTEATPRLLNDRLRQALADVDPRLPLIDLDTTENRIARSQSAARLQSLLFATLAVIAVLLAATGIYGLAAYQVRRRQAEIGLRMALGASRDQLTREILGRSLRPVLLGLILGLALTVGVTRWLREELFGVSALDPASLLGAALLLALTAFVATRSPARRIAAVDPAQTLAADH